MLTVETVKYGNMCGIPDLDTKLFKTKESAVDWVLQEQSKFCKLYRIPEGKHYGTEKNLYTYRDITVENTDFDELYVAASVHWCGWKIMLFKIVDNDEALARML